MPSSLVFAVSMRNKSFISMTGNKRAIANQIFQMLPKDCSALTYYEPFFGSGGAYCNLPVEFKEYRCSDVFPWVIEFVQESQSAELGDIYDEVLRCFDLEHSKQDYHKFRTAWNDLPDGDERKALLFPILANACINGMMRFGPNGFNQSFGGRCISKKDYVGLASMVKPNTSWRICDFRIVDCSAADVVYFDSPYFGTGGCTTQKGFYSWKGSDDEDLLEIVQGCSGAIVSTIEGSFLDRNLVRFRKIEIRKKYKVTPWKFDAKPWKEIVLTNL